MTTNLKKWKQVDGWASKTRPLNLPLWFLDILKIRGQESEQNISSFLEPNYDDLVDPSIFKNINEAVNLITKTVESNGKIVIYGDYDVDGVTATALLYEVVSKVHKDKVSTYIPGRQDEGYGLNHEALLALQKEGAKLIISVDCGINSTELIDSDDFKDMEFIVCDHHEIDTKKLPKKAVIVHPDLVKEGGPLKLAGCGMAFFLARALMNGMPDRYFSGEEKWLLDLVALATVCDVVPLSGQNRVLAKFGLKVFPKTKREGLKALMTASSQKPNEVNSYSLGFLLGPRLNAAGRIESAKKALQLLTTQDITESRNLALELNRLNLERQELCTSIVAQAFKEITTKKLNENEIIVVVNKSWPKGVVGIIASRISDKYGRPAIVFEDDGQNCHGSARSIDGFDITKAFSDCSKYLTKFGGHAKAAGLTLPTSKLGDFTKALLTVAKKSLKKEDLVSEIKIDTKITPEEITDEAMTLLEKLEPIGFGNKTPTFLIEGVEVAGIKHVGSEQNHLKFSVGGGRLAAIFFNNHLELSEGTKYDIVCALRYNEWNNRKSIELRVIDIAHSQI